MLTKLKIENYKSVMNEELDLKPLTLLTGPNSSGKSSVIQALLIMLSHLNMENNLILDEFIDNFKKIDDVLCRFSDEKEVKLQLFENGADSGSIYHFGEEDYFEEPHHNDWRFEENFFYLSASRTGGEEISRKHSKLHIGLNGEYAIGYLELNKRSTVHENLVHLPMNNGLFASSTLKHQVSGWLSIILDIELSADTEEVTSNMAKLFFDSPDLGHISPLHTGAGNSYLLKVLVLCLTAEPDDLLIIENPEIHLHPGAQSRLAVLFSFVAERGVQLIVETHCEHLINRLRYEVFKKNIKNDSIIIHYKQSQNDSFETIAINEKGMYTDVEGNLRDFPKGFFDSTLEELLELC